MTHDEVAAHLAGIDKLQWSEQWRLVGELLGVGNYKQHIHAPAMQAWIAKNAGAIWAYHSPDEALREYRIRHSNFLVKIIGRTADGVRGWWFLRKSKVKRIRRRRAAKS